jgi:hypothetical protein
MVERAVFRVEAVARAVVACVVVLDMSLKAVKWERNLSGVALRNSVRIILESTLAEPREAVVVAARLAVVARCGVDTACPKRRVPIMATLFSDTCPRVTLGSDRCVLFLGQR